MFYLVPVPKQFVDFSGVPYSGGSITVYVHGTTDKAQIYAEADSNVLLNNPCQLDSNGAWKCFVPADAPLDYIVQDRDGNVVASYMNIVMPMIDTAVTKGYVDSQDQLRDRNFALNYDPTQAYPIEGTYVVNEGRLYKSAVVIDEPEEWNADHWTECTVTDELDAKIAAETSRATEAEAAAKTEVVQGENCTIEKTTAEDGHDVFTVNADGKPQIPADWEQQDSGKPDYIKNKPNLGLKADKVQGATAGNLAALDASGNLTDSGKKASDFKTKQTAVPDPAASGNAISFIDTISQDTNGVITPTKKTVSLSSAVDSDAEDAAATPKAVKLAYEHADSVVANLDSEATSTDGTNIQVKVTQVAGEITAVNITTDNTESTANKVSSWSGTVDDTNYPTEKLVKDSLDAKANKSEMTVTPGTGANADKTTIQLKTGTSATVLTAHQDITGKADKVSGASAGNLASLDANGNLVDSGVSYLDMQGEFKSKQTAQSDPTASGNALSFIDTISQDEDGVITATKKNVTIDSALSSTSTNPVQNKAVDAALSGKADKATNLTGATKPKITYNSQGIVTAGTDLVASDIPNLDASKITSGTLPVERGGTGSSTVEGARTNLDVYSKSEVDARLTGRIEVVSSLPTTGEAGVTYYVGPQGSGSDQYEEYIWAKKDGASTESWIKVGDRTIDLSGYKTKQTAKTSPTASGNTLSFIDTVSQNENGEITATKKTVQSASGTQDGVMSSSHYTKLEGISTGANKVEASTTNGNIKIDSTETTVYTHSTDGADTSKGDTTNQTPAFGGTFKVTSETVDAMGHTTVLAEHTVKIPNATAVASTGGTGGSAGLMSAADKEKLNGIATGAEANQNAFSNVKVGTATVAADSKTDTIEIATTSGKHIVLTADTASDKVTIDTDLSSKSAASGGTAESLVTTGEKYTWNSKASGTHTHGNITNDGKIGSTADLAVVTGTSGAVTTVDLTTASPTVPTSGTTTSLEFIDTVTQDSKGKISATKKAVLVDSTYSATGTNPVNGKAIAAAIGGLDSNKTSTDGINVQVKVTEVDGKITAVNITADNTVNSTDLINTINDLDVTAITGSPSKTITSISENDGLIDATYEDILVSTANIDAEAITTAKIADEAVTTGKINNKAVTTFKLDDGAVTYEKVTNTDGHPFAIDISGNASTATHADDASHADVADDVSEGSVLDQRLDTIEENISNLDSTKADRVANATDGNFAGLDGNGNLTDSGKKASDFKTKQTAVTDPTAEGSGLSFIDSVSQNVNGEIAPHKKAVQDGTTAQKGVVQLSNAINSTSTTEAATPKAVKDAYDDLNNKIVARAVFLSQAEWAVQSQLPGDPAKVYYVENGTGEDAYTVYVWKESTSEYVEVDESSIDLDGYWHDGPTTTGNGNVVTDISLGNDGVPQVVKGITALTQHQSVTDNNPTLAWGSTSTVGTVGGTSLQVTMPSNPASGKADNTPTFTEASARANLVGSGETMPTILGKIKKWFTDLKALAFKDNVSDSDISGTISDSHIASVAWSKVSSKPTKLSDFTDDITQSNYVASGTGSDKPASGAAVAQAVAGKISVYDGVVDSGGSGSSRWSKVADYWAANNTQAAGIWIVTYGTEFANGDNPRQDFAILSVNFRGDSTSKPVKQCVNLTTFYSWDASTYAISIVTRGRSVELWAKNDGNYRAIQFTQILNGRGGNTDRWKYYATSFTDKPVEDPSNNIYVYDAVTRNSRDASWINSGTFGTAQIADDAITADKVKDNETLPVNISGAAQKLHASNHDTAELTYQRNAASDTNLPDVPYMTGSLLSTYISTYLGNEDTQILYNRNGNESLFLLSRGSSSAYWGALAVSFKDNYLRIGRNANDSANVFTKAWAGYSDESGSATTALKINNQIGSAFVESGNKTYQLIARFRTDAYTRFSLKLMVGGETGRGCSILFITVERNTNSAGLPAIIVSKVGNRSYTGGFQYGLEYTFDTTNNYLYLYGVTYAGVPMNPILLDDTSKNPTLMILYSRTDTITVPPDTTPVDIRVPASVLLGTPVGSTSTPVYVDSSGQVQPCNPSQMTVGNATKWDGHAISVGTVVSNAGTISIA